MSRKGGEHAAREQRTTLGLAPALRVEEELKFGPFSLVPVQQVSDGWLREVAQWFATAREADPQFQAVVLCADAALPQIRTFWSLFVFACVSYCRQQNQWQRGVPFPENFYLLPLSPGEQGLVFNSGHTSGLAEPKQVPLRWPVDCRWSLDAGAWDHRIELACTLVAQDMGAFAGNLVLAAAGMAADLACSAMERRVHLVENVAPGARIFILLGTAFEALHCKGTSARHEHAAVVEEVERLEAHGTSLGNRVFSMRSICNRPPKAKPGDKVTRPVFVAAHLFYLRNTFAHGRTPADDAYRLSADLNNAPVMDAALSVLACLIGDELSRELGCVLPEGYLEMNGLAQRLGVPLELVNEARIDARNLLNGLEEVIVPKDERRPHGRSPGLSAPPAD